MNRFYHHSSLSLFSFSGATVKNVGVGPESGGQGLGLMLPCDLWDCGHMHENL